LRIGNRPAPYLGLLFMLLTLPGWTQPTFTHGRLIFKGKGDARCLRQIRLYAENSQDDVILKHMAFDVRGLGPWVIFGDPGGEFDVMNWDSTLCVKGLRGQSRVRVSPHEKGGWWITTPLDTFSLGPIFIREDEDIKICELRQHFRLGKNATTHTPLSTVSLLSFYVDPKSTKWLEISQAETLADVPPLVRITAALLAGIHLSYSE